MYQVIVEKFNKRCTCQYFLNLKLLLGDIKKDPKK